MSNAKLRAKRVIFTSGLVLGMVLSSGCGSKSSATVASTSTPTICDPIGTSSQLSAQNGIQASINYLQPSQPRYTQVADYLQYGTLLNANVFLADLNVPTQAFTLGIGTTNGQIIKDNQGNNLIQYFSLHMTTSIALTAAQTPGDYQFAVISDDGFVMTTQPSSGASQSVINNDGSNASKMGCGTTSFHFDSTTVMPVIMNYFQGAPNNIAAVLLWRPVPANAADFVDPLCGASGNSEFFDPSTTPSTPQQPYNDLLGRGWTPVAPANFFLPTGVTNQCSS